MLSHSRLIFLLSSLLGAHGALLDRLERQGLDLSKPEMTRQE
jgi:hypothetical protein